MSPWSEKKKFHFLMDVFPTIIESYDLDFFLELGKIHFIECMKTSHTSNLYLTK